MRAQLFSAAVFVGLASTAGAIPYNPPPQPVYEAPIDRALVNVQAMQGLDDAQRERLLGRLNLLAYARADGDFTYIRDSNRLNETGSVSCSEAARRARIPSDDRTPEFDADDRCAKPDFRLGPHDELPDQVVEDGTAAQARIEAARFHYERAIALEGDNLRARLGYAYALDRLGRIGDARRQLRIILDRGLPRLSEPRSQWEDHAVLTEAAEHLAHLAVNGGERAKMERLRERLQASRPMIYVTPIVVPMADHPFDALIDESSPVAFDFAGTGDTRVQGWLDPQAAWLVWDPERRGHIRSGFEMIGQRTWAVFWGDGFEALRALDDNRDGELTGAELGGLALWRDANGNGVSEPGEVVPASEHGIVSLRVRGERTRCDLITAPDGVSLEDGRTRPLYDWIPGLGCAPTP